MECHDSIHRRWLSVSSSCCTLVHGQARLTVSISRVSARTLTFLLAFLTLAIPVEAHSELVSAAPRPGESLLQSPMRIELQFSQALRPGSTIAIWGPNFQAVSGVQAVVDLTQPTRLVASLPELQPDTYTVQWASISVDGDAMTGSYQFGVQPLAKLAVLSKIEWAILMAALAAMLALKLTRRRRRPTPDSNATNLTDTRQME